MSELTLKWGTLKGWDFGDSEQGKELLKEYYEIGASMGCATQHDTPRQKEIILELIVLCDDPDGVFLDWDGVYVTKEKAKEYILNYGKEES